MTHILQERAVDKYEYKLRAEEIKNLIGEGRYAEAVQIADTVNWKKVKSVKMLCTISDLYKINRRYEGANMALLGMAARFMGILSAQQLRDAIGRIFAAKGDAIVEANCKCFDLGYGLQTE